MTRDEILSVHDRRVVRLDVPEWGGFVFIRTISASERDAFEASMLTDDGKVARNNLVGQRARFAALVLCDENGDRLFTDPNDIKRLEDKSATALDRVLEAGRRLNAMDRQAVEDAEKNSGPPRSDDSISD